MSDEVTGRASDGDTATNEQPYDWDKCTVRLSITFLHFSIEANHDAVHHGRQRVAVSIRASLQQRGERYTSRRPVWEFGVSIRASLQQRGEPLSSWCNDPQWGGPVLVDTSVA
jgi:hypothetical protein